MDAYKKLVLVQLLADGRTSPVPKYTPQAVTRTYNKIAQPYSAFVSAYEKNDAKSANEVHRIAEDKRDAFQKVSKEHMRSCVWSERADEIDLLGDRTGS